MSNHTTASLVVAFTLLGGCGSDADSASSASAATSSKPAPTASAKPTAQPTATATTTAAPATSGSASAASMFGSGPIGKLFADVQDHTDNYKDKPIKFDGLYFSTSTSTSNGKKTTSVTLVGAKDDIKDTLSCDLGENAAPDGLKQYDPVHIEGTGRVSNASRGDNQFKSLDLKECKVEKKK